jgi:hypothetical protein
MGTRRWGPVRRILTVVAVLGVLGLGAVCCQQVLSIDGAIEVRAADSATDRQDVQEVGVDAEEAGIHCGIPMPEGLCATCVTSSCCPQMVACAGDPQCLALETCLLACGPDYGCRSACSVAAYPVGAQPDIPTLDTCVASSCRDKCGMGCGQAASYTTPPDAAAACETCVANPTKNACGLAVACATSLACEISGHCAYACTTPDCRNACANDGGDDTALFNAALTAGTQCYAPCRIGRNWTCLGNVTWPQPDGGAQQATLTLTDAFTTMLVAPPVPGVSVKSCSLDDVPCMSPLSTGTTDDAGVVTLPDLASPIIGFGGYFEMTAPAYVPNLYYLSFPLSQANALLGLSMMSQTALADALAEVNVTPTPGLGTVWVQVADCLLIPAPYVVVKADGIPQTSVVYYAGSNPSATATSTDFSGWAFIYNVPPGPLTLRAIPDDTGIESSTAAIHVRADAMSVVSLLPTALP